MAKLRQYTKWAVGPIMALLVCGAGVGPKEAASHLSEWLSLAGLENVPSWLVGRSTDKWVFLVALIGAVVWLNYILIWPTEKKSQQDVLTPSTSLQLNALRESEEQSEFISMKEAARKLYEAARAGKIPYAEGSERLSRWSNDGPSSGSPEDILHGWAVDVSKELPVYGRRPPSSIIEEIPRREVRHFIVSEEATKLKDPINDLAYYTDLRVKREALDAQYNMEAGFHG
jgi:hypothetical protein